MLRENTSIAFVVDRTLQVLLWSNGLVEATNLTQDKVEGRVLGSLPFLSQDNRDNTTAAIRQMFVEREGGSKRRLVMALAPGAHIAAAATRKVLLQFTAAFFADYQHVVCVGLMLEGALSSLLQDDQLDASETDISSLTSEAYSGILQDAMGTESSLTVALPPGLTSISGSTSDTDSESAPGLTSIPGSTSWTDPGSPVDVPCVEDDTRRLNAGTPRAGSRSISTYSTAASAASSSVGADTDRVPSEDSQPVIAAFGGSRDVMTD